MHKNTHNMDFHQASPNLIDITSAMALAADSITYRLDETQNDRPYFYIKGKDGIPAFLKHGSWDLGDMTGRYLESMIMSRQMIGPRANWTETEQRLLAFLLSLFDNRGLVIDVDKKEPDHAFAQGSALYGLVAAFGDSRDAALQKRIETFVDGLTAHSIPTEDYCVYANVATPNGPCSHMAGYQIVPLVKFYEMTGYTPALALAEKLSIWSFFNDDTIDSEGVVRRIGWEGHLHAWCDTLSGIIQCARHSRKLDKDRIVERCKKTYDWVRANDATDFGWVPDFPTSAASETCAISSMMRLALELVEEGFYDYWNDLERFTRNQLIENQFREVDFLGIEDPRVAGATKGSFDCWAEPNRLFAEVYQWGKEDAADIEGCCVNGGMRGLQLVWDTAIARKGDYLSINLLLNRDTPEITVETFLPREGRIVVTPKTQASVRVRIPDWVNHKEIRVREENVLVVPDQENGCVILRDLEPGESVEISFPVRRLIHTYKAGPKQYEIAWRGDTVMHVSPPGEKYPIYQRS